MRVQVEIDDELMQKALAYGGLGTKKATVDAALRAFVRLKAQEGIRDLKGKIEFWDDYDYKAMREAD